MSHFRGLRAQRMTVPRNGAELDLGDWPMPDDTEIPDPQERQVIVPEPVELYTLANPKEQQS